MIGRREFTLGIGAASLMACTKSYADKPNMEAPMADTIDTNVANNIDWANLTEADWRERLTSMQFKVLRKEATERPGSSPLDREKRDGTFVCAGCDLPLFESGMKYNSGTGWPSFFNVIDGAVGTKEDRKLFARRTEYHCARCGGHQGHIFQDGPRPTGLRYCNNGVALNFVPA